MSCHMLAQHVEPWMTAAAYVLLAPLLGGLLSGLDRILSARMQGRVGPPLLQPFYDVLKLLFEKRNVAVNRHHGYFNFCFLVFAVAAGCVFFAGDDLLISIFAFTLADVFLVLAAYSTNSPYSFVGAQRQLIAMVAAEPAILISAIGLYLATGSFDVGDIAACRSPAAIAAPGTLLCLLFALTIKLRKSPFDISTSHHAHQELVKGLTVEFSGPTLAWFEIAHWYETVMLLGAVFLFFAPCPLLGLAVVLGAYFAEVAIDNLYARFKFRLTLGSAWAAAAMLGGVNILALGMIGKLTN